MAVTQSDPRRHLSRRAIAAWSVAAGCLAACVGSLVVWAASGMGLQPDALLYVVLPVSFGGVGALLVTRVPGNAVGPLLLAAIVGFTTLIGGQTWVLLGVMREAPLPGTAVAGLAAGLAFIPSIVVVLIGIPLIFPTGHLLGPRWRWLVAAITAAVLVAELQPVLGQPLLMEIDGLANPLYRSELAPLLENLDRLAALSTMPLFGLTAASVVIRYRRGSVIERQQLRWLFAASMVAIVAFTLSFNLPEDLRGAAESIGLIAITAYPLAIGIAIVRYRLFDLDRIISRTISYGLVSILLVAAYGTVVLVLQGPLGGVVGDGTASVAMSTLVVAALFQPLRRRVQSLVDRRFDRARFDADATTIAFAERLRDEMDIDAVMTDLQATVASAVRPARTGLWLRGRTP